MPTPIQAVDVAPPEARAAILNGLLAYNAAKTGISDFRPVSLLLHDDAGDVIGGLLGRTALGWLFIELLFVPESLRGQGMGRDLMARAEAEAVARGCHDAWLDTFEFQARGFYERLGYSCFGELPDYPPGFARYFMQKRLG